MTAIYKALYYYYDASIRGACRTQSSKTLLRGAMPKMQLTVPVDGRSL